MSEETIRRSAVGAVEGSEIDVQRWGICAHGHNNGVFFVMDRAGQMREMRVRDLTLLGIASLTGGDTSCLLRDVPKRGKKGKPTGDIDVNGAAQAIMKACYSVGIYDPDITIRSLGVWRDQDRVIAHCGDELFYFANGKRRREPAGCRRGNVIYVAAPSIEPPSAQPATARQACEILDQIRKLWKFAAPHLAHMAFGYLCLAMYGAAPRWRVHIILIGEKGKAGKSTLLTLFRATLGPQHTYTNDPTEAGIRESLTKQGRALIFDEAGAKGGQDRTDRVNAVIGLLRRMSADDGARSVRGTGGAGAKVYSMAGSTALAAANPPDLDAQDRSRILEIDMLPADPSKRELVELAIANAEKLSPALRARALESWPRFLENSHVYRQALLNVSCDARQADQLGTLLAATEAMRCDLAIDSDSAEQQIEKLRPFIDAFREEDEELSNAHRCLGALMSAQVEHWRGGAKSTIGRLVQLALDKNHTAAREALRCYGLQLVLPDIKNQMVEPELLVANRHRGLDKIFAGTDWSGGAWRRALKELPGCQSGDKSEWFFGHKSRFVRVPHKYLPPPDSEQVGGDA